MAGRKITQLPILTTPAATDKLVIVDVSDTAESPQGTSKQIALSNLLGYTEYVALVTQNGTNPPTVTTQSNNTGLTFTSEYNDVGDYVLSFSSYPSAGKVNAQFCNGDSGFNVSAFYTSGTGVKISCFDIASQVLSNSGIGNASLIIRILS
jgi:hypothetical protein